MAGVLLPESGLELVMDSGNRPDGVGSDNDGPAGVVEGLEERFLG